MPKTIIRCRTFMCPLGVGRLGQPDACRFHRAHDNLPADGLCPVHKQPLVKATLPQDCIAMTVMGEEDIEPEIEDRNEAKHRVHAQATIVAQAEAMDAAGDFATPTAKARFIAGRLETLESQIVGLKKDKGEADGPTFSPAGYFLRTPAEVVDYRARRKTDIAKGIVEARKHEDV